VNVSGEQLEAIHRTIQRLEMAWVPDVLDHPVFKPYQVLPVAMLLDALRDAEPSARGRRFLDIGCGVGTTLLLVHLMGYQVSGFDRVPEYIDQARRLVPEADVWVADLFNVEEFDADIILMAHPCEDEEVEREAEEHVIERASEGTILITPGSVVQPGASYINGYVTKVG